MHTLPQNTITAHDLARQLLAGPDHRVAISTGDEYFHVPSAPVVATTSRDEQVVLMEFIDVLGIHVSWKGSAEDKKFV